MKKFFLTSLCLILLSSCAKTPKPPAACVTWTAPNLIYASKLSAEKSRKETTPSAKIRHSKKGLDWAEKCVASFPKEAGCYFYRAVNRGLYIETTMLRYQKGLKKMIKDCEKVIFLDKSYDQGGAYRILGNIYLKTPAFTLSRKSIRRDVDKASQYAQKALKISEADLGNRLLWAEILMEKESYAQALQVLENLVRDLEKSNLKDIDNKKNLKTARKLLVKARKKG